MHKVGSRGLAVGLALAAAVSMGTAALAATVPLTASVHTHNRVVTQERWVTYGRAGYASATVHGTVSGVAPGAVARLYGARFPYRTGLRAVASQRMAVAGNRGTFAFRVNPVLATHYRVEVFGNGASRTPMAISRALVVYVAAHLRSTRSTSCSARVCELHLVVLRVVPPASVPLERSKHLFAYVDVVTWRSGPAPGPGLYHRVAASVLSVTVRGRVIRSVLSIQFRRPAARWRVFAEGCARDQVGRDGLGLAGHHGCGNAVLSARLPYVG